MDNTQKSKRSLARDIAGVFTGNIAAMGAVLLTNIVLSRGLGPTDYGIFTSLLAVLMVSVSIVQLGINRSAVFHLGQQVIHRPTTISSVYTIWAITSIAGILISAISVLVIRNPNFTTLMVAFALLVIPFILGNLYNSGIFLGLEEIRFSNMLHYLPAYLTLILSFLLVWVFKIGVTGAITAALISSLVAFIVTTRHLKREFEIKIPAPRDAIWSVGRLGIVYAMSHMLLQFNYKADVLMLQKMRPAAEVGFYSIGVSIAEQLWLIPFTIGLVLMSRTANDTDNSGSTQRTALLLRTGIILGVTGSIVLWLLAPLLVPLIFGKSYIASIPIIQSILPGIVIFIIFRLLESHLAGKGKPYLALWALIPSLLLNIGLNLWLIPRYGALGSAWATNISYASATVVYVAIYLRTMNTTLWDLFVPGKQDIEKVRRMWNERKKKDRKASNSD